MHELDIADGIVEVVREHAGRRRVTKVHVKVGQLQRIVPSALAFGFEVAAQGTSLEGAELEIQEVAAAGVCRACEAETAVTELPVSCTRCGAFEVEVTRGQEVLVESLDVDAGRTVPLLDEPPVDGTARAGEGAHEKEHCG